ncbi:putative protein C5H10.03 [Ceratocystis platani]|uniref:Uncharacterized protein n=1 Tax=Ceratocystis fimbriata f. sp. platani TaxID=88771 RepID=A0A0F8BTU1_CERFI|nr:putative protein C5H10.03 [Ceratocystis platani]
MPPTVVLIQKGEAQSRDLHENLKRRFADLDPKDVAIIVSPMRRTIQTALIALDFLRQKGVSFVADADWQETTAKPCDTGSDIATLKAEFPAINFADVDPVYPDKTSPAGQKYAWGRSALLARGARARDSLKKRSEKWVIVVSHSGFLRQAVCGWWYSNADYRIFDFVGEAGAETRTEQEADAEVEMTGLRLRDETKQGGMGWSWYKKVQLGEGMKPDAVEATEQQ